MNNNIGRILVFLQFILITLTLIFGRFPYHQLGVFILALGILIGLSAILTMRIRVNIFPEPEHVNELIITGPYKLIRHPMYTAVLLSTATFVTNVITLLSWVLLLIVLLYKLTYEESLLLRKFPEYKTYTTKTKRLLPYVY